MWATRALNVKHLVTGAKSGLGKYLADQLVSEPFFRNSSVKEITNRPVGFNAIIHCATSSARPGNQHGLYQYMKDTLYLTEEITKVPHNLFVYISSIDVYPRDQETHFEDENICLQEKLNLYAATKLQCEEIVKANCQRFLILRPGMLLGRDMRPNNLTRLIGRDTGELTLCADSTFYITTHQLILSFIEQALHSDITGIFNAVPSKSLRLKDLQRLYNPDIEMGSHLYQSGIISNKKIAHINPAYSVDSIELVKKTWPPMKK